MPLDLDTARALRTPAELAGLVAKVVEAPVGTQETNWVEWKLLPDLDSPEHRFKVAKAILGFANRSPARAAKYFQGVAYMIVGAEPGSAPGIPPLDHAVVHQKLAAYLDDGPRWTPYDIDYRGNNVLVIVVEPPSPGDRIHALRKTLDKAYDGTVYHRGAGLTEPANHAAMAMLQNRLVDGVDEPEFDLDLDVVTEPLWRINIDKGLRNDWLRRRAAHIHKVTKKPPPRPPKAVLFEAYQNAKDQDPNSRPDMFMPGNYSAPGDAEEFEKLVQDHLAMCKKLLDRAVIRAIIKAGKNRVAFNITNNTKKSADDVQLVVTVPGGVLVYSAPPSVDDMPPLPSWPAHLPRVLFDPSTVQLNSGAMLRRVLGPNGGTVVKQLDGGGFEIKFELGRLRPGEPKATDWVTMLVPANAGDEIAVTMTGRSMTRTGSRTVRRTISLSPNVWELDDWVRAEPSRGNT